jgi:protein-tyrosine phosphatase
LVLRSLSSKLTPRKRDSAKFEASTILDRLLLSAEPVSVADYRHLQSVGVTHIVRCVPEQLTSECAAVCAEAEVQLHQVPIRDIVFEDITRHLRPACDFIAAALDQRRQQQQQEEKGETSRNVVLVHCQAGVSRSVSIVIAFLMASQKMTAAAALEHVRSRRPIANPNLGFMKQLLIFENVLGLEAPSIDMNEYVLSQHVRRFASHLVRQDLSMNELRALFIKAGPHAHNPAVMQQLVFAFLIDKHSGDRSTKSDAVAKPD